MNALLRYFGIYNEQLYLKKLEKVSVLHEWIISPKSHNIGFIELLDLHN
jgi:hypothetical protein